MAEMERQSYELVYIVKPDVEESQIEDLNQRLNQLITDEDGVVLKTELWGLRTLAYPIGKSFEGHYILNRFDVHAQGTSELERVLRFNENVIRYLVLKADDKE